MLLRPPSAGGCSSSGGSNDQGPAAAAAVVVPDAPLPRLVLGAYPDCVLSKLNGDGIHFASLLKRRIADFCGVSYDRAVAEWMEVEIKVAVEWELNWPFGHQRQPAPQCWWGAYRSAT